MNLNEVVICLYLPPDRTRHKVNDIYHGLSTFFIISTILSF